MTREEAIHRLERGAPFSELYDEVWENALVMAIEALKAEPTKHGHWIDEQAGRWIYAKCSLCRTVHNVKSNYCPNCGARMIDEVK